VHYPTEKEQTVAKALPSKMQSIWVDGALRWGVLTAALFVLFDLLLAGYSSIQTVVIAAVVFPLVGAGGGWWRWRSLTRR